MLVFTESNIIVNDKKFDRKLVERIIALASDHSVKHVVVDGFCGLGGVTAGFSQLPGWMVIACINHWDVAIETHAKNFPDCLHMQEDFRTADITIIMYMLDEIQKRNPSVHVHLWLSLECTNFSNAKGGMSRDADSRTLADFADRYVEDLAPGTVWIENVKEFKLWGPMIPKVIAKERGLKNKQLFFNPDTDNAVEFFEQYVINNQYPQCPLVVNKVNKKKGILKPFLTPWMIPDPNRKGEDFERWKDHICSFGYQSEDKLLNCADYGVPQHRIRLIMQFNRPNLPASYPVQTHDKKGKNGLPKWRPVKPCLDLEDEGESVLSFKMQKGELKPRIKSGKTVQRLINGIAKHVLPERTNDLFITKYLSNSAGTNVNNGNSADIPSSTLTTQHRLYPTKVHLLDHYFGNGYMKNIEEPANTIGTTEGNALHSLQFLTTYHSNGDGGSLQSPSQALMSKDKNPLVTAHFVDHQFSQGQQNKSINEVAGAITTVPKQKVVSVDRFIMDTQYNNGCIELDETARTITANRKHYYLVNFQWFNEGLRTIDKPSNAQIARQDKAPNYLITLETGELAIEVFEHDPPHYRVLKKFMAEHGIVAINMRMLKEIEMLRIMTIPEKTKLSRSSTNNKKMIGNAVPSELIIHLGLAYCAETRIKYKNAA